MTRYTVWHTTGRFDGDADFDALADAAREFDDQCRRRGVSAVELIDNADESNPRMIRRWEAGAGIVASSTTA